MTWVIDAWPAHLEGYGERSLTLFARCELCPPFREGIKLVKRGEGTWITYGGTHVCLTCARRLAEKDGA